MGGICTCGPCVPLLAPGFNRGKTAPGGGRGSAPLHSLLRYPLRFSPPRHQQPAGYSRTMCCIRPQSNLVYRLHQCYSTNERRINGRPAHHCMIASTRRYVLTTSNMFHVLTQKLAACQLVIEWHYIIMQRSSAPHQPMRRSGASGHGATSEVNEFAVYRGSLRLNRGDTATGWWI